MTEFSGLVAIVTGGASGIGAAVVRRLHEGGASIAVFDLNIAGIPEYAFGVTVNVADDSSVIAGVDAVVAKFGRLDIVVNNAGIGAQGDVASNHDDEWHRVWDINVVGMARVSRAALPYLRQSPAAAIVNLSSLVATAGVPQRVLYSATKGAVLAMTRAMAADHIREGIRVNAVNPGTADTPWIDSLLAKADDPVAERKALEARQPHGRLVSPDEIAHAVAYLASPHSGSTSGTSVAVDGGMQELRLRPEQTMSTPTVSTATEPTFELSEGVIWDDRAQLVRWVDILQGRVLAGRLNGAHIDVVDDRHFGQTAGAVALAEDGGLLVAAAHGLATVSPSGEVSFGPDLEEYVAPNGRGPWRMNDGIVDPQGRFLVGTLSLEDVPAGHDQEVLLRISPDGSTEVLRTGLGMSNGLGFAPDGSTVFHIDTLAGTLSSHSYSAGEFDSDEPWVTIIDDFPHFADGMTVDASGDLWIAFWGGSHFARYAADGHRVGEVYVNAQQPTCVGFVGESLNRLAITSALLGLGDVTDDSGAIFVSDVGAVGKHEYRWMGSTISPSWRTD
jgi:NAD(P)-dependent dehydrogenase (short-subunit alcohol dehydrogenase family)/sugar lactone lactonase YvrE